MLLEWSGLARRKALRRKELTPAQRPDDFRLRPVCVADLAEFLPRQGLETADLGLGEFVDGDDILDALELLRLDLLPLVASPGWLDLRRPGVGDIELGQAHAEGGPEPRSPGHGIEIER